MSFDNMVTRRSTDKDRARTRRAFRWYFIIYCVLTAVAGSLALRDYFVHKLELWLIVQVLMISIMTVISHFQLRKVNR